MNSLDVEWCSTGDATKARCLYGQIPEEHWSYPKWVSPLAAAEARVRMRENGVLYGGRESYHHMCRYFSGFIHKHPLLKEFDFYWRMEPDVHYYCSLDYDPFLFMQVSWCPVLLNFFSNSSNSFKTSLLSSAFSSLELLQGVTLSHLVSVFWKAWYLYFLSVLRTFCLVSRQVQCNIL